MIVYDFKVLSQKGEEVERFGSMDKPESFIDRVKEELKK